MTHGMYVCMYIRMYVCMYTCMCLCTYHTWMPCTSSLCSLKSGLYFKLTKGCMIEPGTLEWARPRLWPSSCTTALKRSLPPETAYTRICYTHTHSSPTIFDSYSKLYHPQTLWNESLDFNTAIRIISTAESWCLWSTGTDTIITNISINCQCKISVWFQELTKYQKQKQNTTTKITIKNDNLLSIQYKHLCKYKLQCMIEGQSLSIYHTSVLLHV